MDHELSPGMRVIHFCLGLIALGGGVLLLQAWQIHTHSLTTDSVCNFAYAVTAVLAGVLNLAVACVPQNFMTLHSSMQHTRACVACKGKGFAEWNNQVCNCYACNGTGTETALPGAKGVKR